MSTLIRVQQGSGLPFLPEIGDEVLVTFLNGDPDRPLILAARLGDDGLWTVEEEPRVIPTPGADEGRRKMFRELLLLGAKAARQAIDAVSTEDRDSFFDIFPLYPLTEEDVFERLKGADGNSNPAVSGRVSRRPQGRPAIRGSSSSGKNLTASSNWELFARIGPL